MKYCVDTWFLIKLAQKDAKALEIKRNAIEGKNRLFIPTIVITEIFRKLYQKGKKESDIESFLRNLIATEKIKTVFLDETIAKEAAKVSVSHSIPTVDSIVVATYINSEADSILTDDYDIKKLSKKRAVRVENW